MKKLTLTVLISLTLIMIVCSGQAASPKKYGEISLAIPDNWTVRKEPGSTTFIGPDRKAGATVITTKSQGSETTKQMADALASAFGGNTLQRFKGDVYLVKIPGPAVPAAMKRGLNVSDQDLEVRMFVSADRGFFLIVCLFGRDAEISKVVKTLKGVSREAQGAVDLILSVDIDKY